MTTSSMNLRRMYEVLLSTVDHHMHHALSSLDLAAASSPDLATMSSLDLAAMTSRNLDVTSSLDLAAMISPDLATTSSLDLTTTLRAMLHRDLWWAI